MKTNKVVLNEQISIDADIIIEELREKARSIGVGSGCVDQVEWKAASIIRSLLRDRDRGFEGQVQVGGVEITSLECNCAYEVDRHDPYHFDYWVCPAHGLKYRKHTPECICAKMMTSGYTQTAVHWAGSMFPGQPSVWICPLHGYKRR